MKRLAWISFGLLLLAVISVYAAPGDKTFFVTQSKFTAYSANRAAVPFYAPAMSGYTSSGPDTANSRYRRVMEVRNASGKIVYYINASGQMIIGGNPVALAVTDVYPANGATGLYNNYSTGTGGSKRFTGAYVAYTKNPFAIYSATQTISGLKSGLSQGATTAFSSFSAAAATTYTIRVYRKKMQQYDGEYTSACGSVMTDVSGVCTSTFTTR